MSQPTIAAQFITLLRPARVPENVTQPFHIVDGKYDKIEQYSHYANYDSCTYCSKSTNLAFSLSCGKCNFRYYSGRYCSEECARSGFSRAGILRFKLPLVHVMRYSIHFKLYVKLKNIYIKKDTYSIKTIGIFLLYICMFKV